MLFSGRKRFRERAAWCRPTRRSVGFLGAHDGDRDRRDRGRLPLRYRSIPGSGTVAALRPLPLLAVPQGHRNRPRHEPLHGPRSSRVDRRTGQRPALRPTDRAALRGLLLPRLRLPAAPSHPKWHGLGDSGRLPRSRAFRGSVGSHLLVVPRELVVQCRRSALLRWLRERLRGADWENALRRTPNRMLDRSVVP